MKKPNVIKIHQECQTDQEKPETDKKSQSTVAPKPSKPEPTSTKPVVTTKSNIANDNKPLTAKATVTSR